MGGASQRDFRCESKAPGERQKTDEENARAQPFLVHLGPPPKTLGFPGWAAQMQPSQLRLVVLKRFPTEGTRELSRQIRGKSIRGISTYAKPAAWCEPAGLLGAKRSWV